MPPGAALGGQLTPMGGPMGEGDLNPMLHTLRDLNNLYENNHGNVTGGIGTTGVIRSIDLSINHPLVKY